MNENAITFNNLMLEGVVRLTLGIIKYYDFLEKESDTFSDCSDDLDAEFNDTLSQDSTQMDDINQVFKDHTCTNYFSFLSKEKKYQDLTNVKNIKIKTQKECDEYVKFLYETSMSLKQFMILSFKNRGIKELYPIKFDKEDVLHDKSFYLCYFDRFAEESGVLNADITLSDQTLSDQTTDVKLIEKLLLKLQTTDVNLMEKFLLKLYEEPCAMFILCFINHYEKRITINELDNALRIMKFLESSLVEVIDQLVTKFPEDDEIKQIILQYYPSLFDS